MTGHLDEQAQRLIATALELAGRRGMAVSIAVVDGVGALVAFRRMDGAPRFSADFAVAKARTAATFAVPTATLEDLYRDRPAFAQSFIAQGGYFLGRGGAPVVVDGEVAFGIGISGADAGGEDEVARIVAGVIPDDRGGSD